MGVYSNYTLSYPLWGLYTVKESERCLTKSIINYAIKLKNTTKYATSTKNKILRIFNDMGKYCIVLSEKSRMQNCVCVFIVVMHIHYMHGKMGEGNSPKC